MTAGQRRGNGWEKLRREIEALLNPSPLHGAHHDGFENARAAVLAIVDRLAPLPPDGRTPDQIDDDLDAMAPGNFI